MKIHIVKQGDSLYALSQKYGVPLQKIIEANPQISNPNVLALGEKVKIPTAPVSVPDNSEVYYKHTVKQGDTLWKLSKAWGIPLKDMVEANPQLKNPNVLMLGEVVNIPKKTSNASPVQPGYMPSNASEKTQVGGKEYTGPKEQPVAEVVPAPKPETKPEVKPETKPEAKAENKPEAKAENKPEAKAETKPAPKSSPNISPLYNSAPHPSMNMAPINTQNAAPNAAPNMQMEVAPVQEIEMQSLFVQITVPNQEPVAHHEAAKAEIKPVACKEEKADACDNMGYPGLGGNPYLYDSYQNSPNMNMNWAPSYVQPASYGPECMSPYYFSENMYSPNMSPEQWNPNAAPNVSPEQWNPNAAPNVSPEQWNPNSAPNVSPEQYMSPEQWNPNAASNMSPEQWNPNAWPNMSPEQWNPNAWPNMSPEQWNPNAWPNMSPEQWNPNAAPNVSPEQWNPNAAPNNMEANVSGMNPMYGMSPNLPWPTTCGCGGMHVQPYSYEMPVYNTYPAYGNPNAFSAYGAGTPNQGIVPASPLGAFGGPIMSSIPSNPQYPGIGNYSQHNRVPEIQDPETFVQDTPEVARTVSEESTSGASLKSKGTATKETASKAKTSSQSSSKKNKTAVKSQRSNAGGRTESSKKRRNPWISN
ncbi:LysM peptidoglycan-binding domain-containing protein [Paenibacillus sp. FSL H7-0737]|uniref:LysM peptidoglycan-binding domain-containing protein n=1 Tax=Paenibacillus sp. FSL H7-0737 TaxID=1536775 RepID=UPI000693A2AE|nr:LysM peptidoglycan-binding domain-containing protein [Paenibacillus sp. FSL H7-0737]